MWILLNTMSLAGRCRDELLWRLLHLEVCLLVEGCLSVDVCLSVKGCLLAEGGLSADAFLSVGVCMSVDVCLSVDACLSVDVCLSVDAGSSVKMRLSLKGDLLDGLCLSVDVNLFDIFSSVEICLSLAFFLLIEVFLPSEIGPLGVV